MQSNLPFVTVHFTNSENDYQTNVSAQSTKESAESYFVGKCFTLGNENHIMYCTGITFHAAKKTYFQRWKGGENLPMMGGFMRSLMECYLKADLENAAKLEKSFPELFTELI